ncbi:uncharacterized protein DUF3810 [Chitinophaga niastensis]|uniref:Uncharacterized protein DUF3810 n=1 Tax=Chitinophaga niastensis TaxID=536980 RepID=A0A2P8HPB3_CHINA|nr:DUF3810 domain-containing protein [Chitinophaga niastensis]PSL48054.1 uncharacterized protein DUF3810 [Chitinophaga niastensis]
METKAQIKKKIVRIVLTLTAILLLKGLFAWSNRFSDFYFHRWYDWSSLAFRQITGIVPFSVGDVIYTAWIVSGIFYLLKLCYKLIRLSWQDAGLQVLRGIHFLLKVYLAFLILWGFNYERNPLTIDTGLVSGPYNTQQLYQLSDTLLQLVNKDKANTGDTLGAMVADTSGAPMFQKAVGAYAVAAKTWPALRYRGVSVKPAMFGNWLNYTGTTGYLNPFTNEAQINTTVPAVLQPFITCHEIAHQLGYAPEEDANFVGYLAATSIPDSHFRYAANFDMFMYSVRQLGHQDTTLAKAIWNKTLPGVKADYKSIITFYEAYTGKVDDYSAMLYDRYLKANKQEKGIRSYSEVTGWLIAYFKIK